jgi:acyl-CoA synthetase (AMP-forming)/AMP-acid ligase II
LKETSDKHFLQIEGKKYFRTGDLAWIDERGYLTFVGRCLENIVIDGKEFYPALLEKV